MKFTTKQETRMIAWLESKGIKGDDEWTGLDGGASTLVDNVVVILREKGDLVEVLAPIAPDERGTKIPVDNEPAPLALQKSMSCPSFHAAMKIQARAIAEVYRQAGLDIHGKSL